MKHQPSAMSAIDVWIPITSAEATLSSPSSPIMHNVQTTCESSLSNWYWECALPDASDRKAANHRRSRFGKQRFLDVKEAMMGTILIVLLILLLIGAIPSWPHSRNWGYFPSGLLGLILIVVIILAIVGRL